MKSDVGMFQKYVVPASKALISLSQSFCVLVQVAQFLDSCRTFLGVQADRKRPMFGYPSVSMECGVFLSGPPHFHNQKDGAVC